MIPSDQKGTRPKTGGTVALVTTTPAVCRNLLCQLSDYLTTRGIVGYRRYSIASARLSRLFPETALQWVPLKRPEFNVSFDVPITNNRHHRFRGSPGPAFFTGTDLTKPLPRVDAVPVTIAERESHAISADVLGPHNPNRFRNRVRIEDSLPSVFINTPGAGALAAEPLRREYARVPIAPFDSDLRRTGL